MGAYGMDSFLAKPEKEDVPCRFCGGRDRD